MVEHLTRPASWSLRTRLVAIIAGVLGVALIIGGLLMLRHARASVEVEMQSNLRMVRQLIGAYLVDPNAPVSDLQLDSVYGAISQLRHVHAMVSFIQDPDSSVTAIPVVDHVPAWFVCLVAPPVGRHSSIVLYGPGQLRRLTIETNPVDEIQEVWHDMLPLVELVTGVFIAVCIAVHWTVGRGLRPLNELARAIEHLELDDSNVQVSETVVPELAPIHRRFNAMAQRLQASLHTNRELSNHLVALQENERKALARELHDEMGPNLFNIQVDISTGMLLAEQRRFDELKPRLLSVESTVSQLQAQTREMISKLRPLVLEEMGLEQVLRDMVAKWHARYTSTNWRITIDGNLDDLGDPLTVTVYRIVQECLTNVVRHAQASEVTIELSRRQLRPRVECARSDVKEWIDLRVSDNGQGIVGYMGAGYGLCGMRERAMALGGEMRTESTVNGGFMVSVRLPVLCSDIQAGA